MVNYHNSDFTNNSTKNTAGKDKYSGLPGSMQIASQFNTNSTICHHGAPEESPGKPVIQKRKL